MIGLALALLAVVPAHRIMVAPGSGVTTVRQALAQAAEGDTIVVTEGHYREARLMVDRRVTILGQGQAIVDGGGEPIFIVTADGVTLRGLTLQDVATSFTEDRAAIRLEGAGGCDIDGNVIRDSFFAIYAARAHDCLVRNNRITGRGGSETDNANAIHLYATRGFVVEHNDVRRHRDGIYLEFARQAVIRDNLSEQNGRYGLHFMFSDSCTYARNRFRANRAGVAVMYSGHVEIDGNTFADATGPAAYGLLLKDIHDSRVRGNLFSGNTVALSLEGGDRVGVEHNQFERNGWAVRLYADAQGGHFDDNRFAANAFDVVTNSREGHTSFSRNFWDRYEGYDLDRDGIGDVPYRPVRLFGLIVAQHPAAIVLLNSFFLELLETAERVAPVLSPATPVDTAPRIRWAP